MKKPVNIILIGLGLTLALAAQLLSELVQYRNIDHSGTAASPPGFVWWLSLRGVFSLVLLALFTLLVRRERLHATELRRLASVVENATDIIFITDTRGTIEYVNPGFERATGYSSIEVIGKTPRILKSASHDDEYFRELWTTVLAGKEYRGLLVNQRKDRTVFYEEKSITPIRDKHGHISRFLSTGKDVTDRIYGQEQIHYLAHHDILTGLPNRVKFRKHLNEALARTRRNDKLLALLFLDLDNFKRINDSLGHDIGDLLLKQVTERLQDCIRETDSVSRLGGDEFTVILENINHVNNVTAVAQKLVCAIGRPFNIESHVLHVSVSIGITLYPLDDSTADLLIKNADMAMYHAKELGRNGFQYYSADLSQRVRDHMQLESELHRALEREEFVLHYQPIVDAHSGLVTGAEVLLRWQHPERGLVWPSEFIPVLEDCGLIMPVTEWVLNKATEQIRGATPEHAAPLSLSINVTANCFRGNGFAMCAGTLLATYGGETGQILVEVTESVLMQDTRHVLDIMNDLRAIGVRIALDDFGTGQSSLSHLRKFPIDVVKIDRDFIRDIPRNQGDMALVSAIIGMAHGLGKTVVAEGVETEAQLAFLREHRCDGIQGFLFSRPVPIEQMATLIGKRLQPGGQVS